MGLSTAQVEHYREHGWVAPVDVMSHDEATAVQAALETAEAAYPEHLHAENRNNAHHTFVFLANLAGDPRIVDAAESLVGPNIVLWSTVLFAKAANSGSFVSWHQDANYMGVAGDNMVTAWLALTPSTIDSGCVSVIPQSHTKRATHVDTNGEDNLLTRGQEVADIDESTAVHLELQPGQMSLHHPWIVHGSQPNLSDRRRIGLAFQTYMGTGIAPTRGTHMVSHIRGDVVHPDFVIVPPPAGECDAAGVTNRAAANQAFSDILYDGAKQRRKL